MKQVVTIAVLFTGLSFFTSCSKKADYRCHCEGGFTGGGMEMQIPQTTSRKATEKCASFNMPQAADGYYNCKLK